MKKALCICLALLLCVCSLPIAGSAAEFDQFNTKGLLHWTQIPIVSEELLQTEQVTIGGEGCQWPLAVSVSRDGSLVLLGTDVGGVYRSTDSGKTYTPQNVGLQAKGGSAFAIDPWNNDRVLMVGVGSNFASMNGIYLSTDRANTWSQRLESYINGTRDVRDSVAFDPSSYDETIDGCAVAYYSVCYTDTDRQELADVGLYKSTDGGVTWGKINDELYNVAIKVATDGTVYVSGSNFLKRSTDGGASWTECYTGEITGFDLVYDSVYERDKIVISDSAGIIVSYDGITFSRIDSPTYPTADNVSGLEGSARNVMISPVDTNYMLVCYVRSNLYNSINFYTHDGGQTWERSVLNNELMFIRITGAHICTFAWTGNDRNKVYSFGGDMVTSSVDGGAIFNWDNNGFNGILVGGEFHFNVYDPDIVYFGAQDYNGAATADGGKTWRYVNFSGKVWGGHCYGGYAADENTFFSGHAQSWDSDREICITYDGGKTMVHTGVTYSVTDGILPRGIESAYQSVKNPNIFFQTFFRSPDGGRTWNKMTDCIGVYGHDTDSGRLFGIDTTRHYVVYSDDDGITWNHLNTEPIGTNYTISDLSVDSRNDLVYVAYGDKYLGKIQSNGTWSCILSKEMNIAPLNDRGALVVKNVAVDPNHPEVLYCGGTANYYMNTSSTLRSTDGGASWQCVTPNNDYAIINADSNQSGFETVSLSVHPVTGELWAAGSCMGFARLSAACENTDEHPSGKRIPVTVTFRAGNSVFQTDEVGTGLCPQLPANVPTQPGKVFDGWYADESCTEQYDFLRRINEDTTVYAKFADALTVTCRAGATVTQYIIGKGQAFTPPEVTLFDGLYFSGWYADYELTEPFVDGTALSENTTLYAGYYKNIYDSSVQDYFAYIANSTHKLSSATRVDDETVATNRVTSCTVEPNKTYTIAIDMDCRFRGGAVETVQTNTEISNYFQDESDINTSMYVGGKKTATVTTGENETTLLIFYWTTYSGCTDFLKIRQSIAVYDPATLQLAPGTEEEPTEPTTEAPTEPTTEPPTEPPTEPMTEPTTEPPTEPQIQSCSCICHKDGIWKVLYPIVRFFWKLFGMNPFCACDERHY